MLLLLLKQVKITPLPMIKKSRLNVRNNHRGQIKIKKKIIPQIILIPQKKIKKKIILIQILNLKIILILIQIQIVG